MNSQLQEDDRPDIEPQVEEDLDLWDLLNAYIFGEQDDDDDNENENSKSGSAADRDSNGHTYKATKRKLLSVEDVPKGRHIKNDDSSHVHHDRSGVHHTIAHSHDSKTQGMMAVEEAAKGDRNIDIVEEQAEMASQGNVKQEKGSNVFSSIFNVISKIIDDLLLYW